MIDLIVLIFVMLITSFGIYFSTLPFVPDIMINALWAFFYPLSDCTDGMGEIFA